MIVYFDNGRHPLFRDAFTRCGQTFVPLIKKRIPPEVAFGLLEKGHLAPYLVCVDPPCAPDDDKIIVFDTMVNARYLIWLRERHPDKRIILWFWNPIDNFKKYADVPRSVEFWSYSERDCIKYGLRHNTQFFFDCFAAGADKTASSDKVLFIGREKDRLRKLLVIGRKFSEAGLDFEMHLVHTRDTKAKGWSYEPYMPYERVIELVRGAGALLDYYTDPEAGLSLRTLESVFLGKKLFTNNVTVDQYDFYDDSNIYIFGKSTGSIADFMKRPYRPADPAVIDRYRLSRWLERFDEPSLIKQRTE